MTFYLLSPEEQAQVLATLAFHLTIWAREAYQVGTDSVLQPEYLRGCNEIQHKLLGQLHRLLSHDDTRYPDQIFFDIIFEMSDAIGLRMKLQTDLETALNTHANRTSEVIIQEALYA